jgi:hypothetical protein
MMITRQNFSHVNRFLEGDWNPVFTEYEVGYKYYVSGQYPLSCYNLKQRPAYISKPQRFGDWILSPASAKTYSIGPNR